MRTVALRVAGLALLLLLTLVTVIGVRTLQRVPDTVIYFVKSGETHFSLQPVNRRLGRHDPVQLATLQVAELAKGPQPDEAAGGLSSVVPPGTLVLSAHLDGGVLTVNVNAAFESGGGTSSMVGRLNQLFYTLSQPAGVTAVKLRVEGRDVEVFSGEGLMVANPWVRSEEQEEPRW